VTADGLLATKREHAALRAEVDTLRARNEYLEQVLRSLHGALTDRDLHAALALLGEASVLPLPIGEGADGQMPALLTVA
jgi:hypothetical protein